MQKIIFSLFETSYTEFEGFYPDGNDLGENITDWKEACEICKREPLAVGFCSNGKNFWVKHTYTSKDIVPLEGWKSWTMPKEDIGFGVKKILFFFFSLASTFFFCSKKGG